MDSPSPAARARKRQPIGCSPGVATESHEDAVTVSKVKGLCLGLDDRGGFALCRAIAARFVRGSDLGGRAIAAGIVRGRDDVRVLADGGYLGCGHTSRRHKKCHQNRCSQLPHLGFRHLNVIDAAPTGDDMLDGFSFWETNWNCLPMEAQNLLPLTIR